MTNQTVPTTLVATNALKPYPNNPRVIPPEAVDVLAASIHEFGFRQPIIADRENVIIAGHTRHQAALKLELPEVPVHYFDGSEAEANALRLADNRTQDLTYWNYAQRDEEIRAFESPHESLKNFWGERRTRSHHQ